MKKVIMLLLICISLVGLVGCDKKVDIDMINSKAYELYNNLGETNALTSDDVYLNIINEAKKLKENVNKSRDDEYKETINYICDNIIKCCDESINDKYSESMQYYYEVEKIIENLE